MEFILKKPKEVERHVGKWLQATSLVSGSQKCSLTYKLCGSKQVFNLCVFASLFPRM